LNKSAIKYFFKKSLPQKIPIILSMVGFIVVVGVFYLYSHDLGNMVFFFSIFIITLILVAKYHEDQIKIIFVACALSLLFASILLDEFSWNVIIEHYIEWDVLAVIFGMLLLTEAVSETGFFDWFIILLLKVSQGRPFPLFVLTFFITLVMSAFLANVTAIILISSMIINICKSLDYDPIPLLFAALLATDVAGMATLVSSLPAILVGSAAEIGYIDFLLISFPFLLLAIPICIYYLKKFFPPERIPLEQASENGIGQQVILSLDPWSVVEDKETFFLSGVALGVTIIGFAVSQFIYIPIGVIAILGGILALLLTKANEDRVLSRLNWNMILFFSGLFILVGVLRQTKVLDVIAEWIETVSGGNIWITSLLLIVMTTIFSGLLDNIPVTIAFIPVIEKVNIIHMDSHPLYLWFILVFAGSLGGGWTPFGSAAGVYILALLKQEEHPLDFKYFVLCFLPISVILLIISAIYLTFLAVIGVI
jgi:Na+/H+ antiporter NhaD/arsenite permease-like protein